MKVSRLLAGGLAALSLPAMMLAALPAQANSSEAAVTAGWLADQVNSGTKLVHTQWGPDYGLSADTLIALDLLGGHDSTVDAIGAALAANPQAYISGEAFGDEGSTYAGATGKLTYTLDSIGLPIRNISEIDLVERLESVIVTEGENAGRGMDVSSWGDYSNGVGQAWVIRGLVAGESELADEAVNYTLGKQCADGGFPVDLNATTCTSAHDTTAYTIAALREAKAAGVVNAATLDAAIADAVDSLKNAQATDGSFGAGDGINSNTTGLAAWVLREAGETAAADKAVAWVRGVYAEPTGALSSEAGAIAFNPEAFDEGVSAGAIPEEARDQWTRATAQAALAWLGASDPEVTPEIIVTAPSSVFAGEEFTVEGSGYEEGDEITIDISLDGGAGGQNFAAFKFAVVGTETAGPDGTFSKVVTAPNVAGDYTLSLLSERGIVSTPLEVRASNDGEDSDDEADVEDVEHEDADAASLDDSGNDMTGGLIAGGALLLLAGGGALWAARRRLA